MKNSLRSFASGLLIATTLIGAVYLFGPSKAESSDHREKKPDTKQISEKEMIDQLASKGYVIHTEDEWNKKTAAAADKEKADEESEQKQEGTSGEKIVYRAILSVSDGMTSIDVGNALENAKILENGIDFYKEVEKRGLENDLRPGTFEIESGMSMDKIISIIFE
ncbi:endolytic transglycosylase MltG [Bacillus salacetis]|nr:endolytic transglycosylase MltG [Bacillus salacetis]